LRTTFAAAIACCALASLGCSGCETDSHAAGEDAGAHGDATADGQASDGGGPGDAAAPLPRPAVDGVFDEWTDADLLVTDPTGDATSVFDVTKVWATSRGASLYLRVHIAEEPLNMQSGWSGEAPLRLEVGLPGGRSLSVDLRQHTVLADGSEALRWSEVGFQLAPTTAATEVEIGLDLSGLGVVQGDSITIDFSGSDSLPAPAPLVLTPDALEPAPLSAARADGTTFRIASLNVEFDGLTEPGRAEPIGRLLHAVAADVYCLQEVWTTEAAEIAATLAQIDPHGDGATWNVHRTGDTAIATPWPLTELPHDPGNPPYTGAGIELPGGSRLMVFTLRPTCCGFIGNPADEQRIAELQQLASAIIALRGGTLGAAFEPFRDAPVVVLGDWNLVGSTTPLEVMTDPSGAALERWLLRHLAGDGAIFTWRSDALGSFAPGTLDVLAHGSVPQAGTLAPLAGYVLDSGELDGAMLAELGLRATDSLATDHLLLVADFGL